jgi:hypothetical protein
MDLSSAIIGILLMLICILPFILIGNKNAKKRKKKLQIITNSAKKMNGAIYKNEFWTENGMGIDKTNKMLYFSTQSQEPNSYKVISLKGVQDCSIIRNENASKSITKLALQLNYTDKDKQSVELAFYERDKNLNLVNELELVHKWAAIIKEQL